MRRLLLASLLLAGGCAWRGPRPGPTKEGFAVAVLDGDAARARRSALESALVYYLSPAQQAASKAALDALLAEPARFVGKERRLEGGSVVEVRLDPLGAALDQAGLLRPAGFPVGPGRVLIVLTEPAASLSAGFASDALRRALVARGIPAADANDVLLQRPALRSKTPQELAAEAFSSGVDHVLLGAAAVESAAEPAAGLFRAQAVLDARLKSSAEDAGELVEASGEAVDVSSAAASASALAQAGETAAAAAAGALAAARSGRELVVVEARGGGGPARLAALITALRAVAGVKGAALLTHRAEEGAALVRVYCAGIKADELAARLVRVDPTVSVWGVEPENRRLIVELVASGGY